MSKKTTGKIPVFFCTSLFITIRTLHISDIKFSQDTVCEQMVDVINGEWVDNSK